MQTYQMRVLELLDDLDVVELDVEELVDALERATNGDVVLELDRHFMVDEGLEEAVGARGGKVSVDECCVERWLWKVRMRRGRRRECHRIWSSAPEKQHLRGAQVVRGW